MELRQLIVSLLFVVAAVMVKTAMPTQLDNGVPVVSEVKASSYEPVLSLDVAVLTSALPFNEVSNKIDSVILSEAIAESNVVASVSDSPEPVPGSIIALVVAALGLVAVARRAAV